jgi:hypothetical protein
MRNRCGDESTTAAGAGGAASLVLKLARLGLVAAVASVLLAVGATAASAAPSHKFAQRFGLPNDTNPLGLAVQQSSGDLYTLDRGAQQRVLHMGADGSFIGQFGPGLSPDAGTAAYTAVTSDDVNDEILLADPTNFADRPNGAVDRFGATGTFISQIDEANVPAGVFQPNQSSAIVAVNPSNGNVYVAHAGINNDCNPDSDPLNPPGVYVFDSSGSFVMNVAGTGTEGQLNCPIGVAVDAAGSIYVQDASFSINVKKFTPLGTYDSTPYADGGASNIAVNQASGALYVVEGNRIIQFDSSGNRLAAFGSDVLAGPSAIAVKASSDRVYVTDSGSIVAFDPFVTPDVTTDPASDATTDGATLHGTVNPQGNDSSVHYEWGVDTNYGNFTTETPVGNGSSPVAAPAEVLTGLAPNTTYHYKLVASDADGSFSDSPPADQTFTTLPVAPTVGGESESNLHSTTVDSSATLNATINPNNAPTTYRFEWGTDTSYGNSVPVLADPPGDAGAGGSPVPVTAALEGLDAKTEYHWRITATNGTDGQVNGTDQMFTTLPLVPEVTIGPAATAVTDITQTSATFHATVDTKGLSGTYHFTASSGSYTDSTALIDIPEGTGPRAVSATLDGLPTESTVSVRAVIKTDAGSAQTETVDFVTKPFTPFTPEPRPGPDDHPYGCVTPHLNNYAATAKPGKTITLTGSDLGIGGVVTFGATEADTDAWTAGSIQTVVPSSAKGTAKVTANCGNASNTINVKIAKKKVTCKKGQVKKKVHGKTKCVKKKAKKHKK